MSIKDCLEPSAKRLCISTAPVSSNEGPLSSLPHDLLKVIFHKCCSSFADRGDSPRVLDLRRVNKLWSAIVIIDTLPYIWKSLSEQKGLIDFSRIQKTIPESYPIGTRFRHLLKFILKPDTPIFSREIEFVPKSVLPVSKAWFLYLEKRFRADIKSCTNNLKRQFNSTAADKWANFLTSPSSIGVYFRGNIVADLCCSLAHEYRILNQHQKALQMLDLCKSYDPDNPLIISTQCLERVFCLFVQQGNVIPILTEGLDALKECDQSTEELIDMEVILRRLLAGMMMHADPLRASEELTHVASLYLKLASNYMNQKNFEEVSMLIDLARQCEPTGNVLARVHLYCGKVLSFSEGNENEVIAKYKAGLETVQDDSNLRAELYISYRHALDDMEKIEEIVQLLEKGLIECTDANASNNALLHFQLAKAYDFLDDESNALLNYQKAIELCPKTEREILSEIYIEYGRYLLLLYDYKGAGEIFKQFFSLSLWKVLALTLLNKDNELSNQKETIATRFFDWWKNFDDGVENIIDPSTSLFHMCFDAISAIDDFLEGVFLEQSDENIEDNSSFSYFEKSIGHCLKGIHLPSEKDQQLTAQLYFILGSALGYQAKFENHKFDSAITQLKIGLTACPETDPTLKAFLHLQLGHVLKNRYDTLTLKEQGNLDEAKIQFEAGLKACPKEEAQLILSLLKGLKTIKCTFALIELRNENLKVLSL